MELKQVSELKIKQEYEKLIPDLPKPDYQELKKSIQTDGLYHAIVINENNEILDGHHRYKACNELGIEFRTELKKFDTLIKEKKFVIKSNFNRRHLEMVDRARLATELDKLDTQGADERQKTTQFSSTNQSKRLPKKVGNITKPNKPRKPVSKEKKKERRERTSKQRAAKSFSLSDKTLEKYQYVMKHGSPETIKQMEDKWIKITKAYNAVKKEEKKQALLNEKPVIELPTGCDLRLGDFRQDSTIADNSIDLIFTDPPYGLESVPLYKDLAEVAQRVLKEGGSLVAYAGQYTLPQVMKELEGSGLKYWWIFCVKHGGAHDRSHPRSVFIEWKPLLWYVKGDKANIVESITDYVQSDQPDKALHDWEQSAIEAEHVIKRLTVKNQIVLDSFLGTGTTGIVALHLNRKFIGMEIDEPTFQIAQKNIALRLQKGGH